MDARVNVPTRPAVVSAEVMDEWLEYAASDLVDRLKELTAVLFQLSVDHPVIADGDDETAGIFTENLKMIAALRKAVEDFHKKEKAPYLALGKQVDNWLNGFVRVLDGMDAPLREALRAFAAKRDTSRIFEDKEPIRGHYGVGTAVMKDHWTYEVEDITKVPVEYLTVDDRLVKAVLADRHPKTRVPKRKIPGIRWVRNRQLAVS